MRARRVTQLPLRHLPILPAAIGLLPLALLGAWSVHAASEYRQRDQERAMLDVARAQARAQPDWPGVILTDADGKMLFRTAVTSHA